MTELTPSQRTAIVLLLKAGLYDLFNPDTPHDMSVGEIGWRYIAGFGLRGYNVSFYELEQAGLVEVRMSDKIGENKVRATQKAVEIYGRDLNVISEPDFEPHPDFDVTIP